MKRSIPWCCFIGLAGIPSSAAELSFQTPPSVTEAEGTVELTFRVSAPTDVEVAVLDSSDNVICHLAAGVLGGSSPPPPPLAPGLAQKLEWNGKDDLGRDAIGGPFKVRVRAGSRADFGAVLGEPSALASKMYGLATDERGQLYVASGGGYGRNIFTIKVFNREGGYLRTIFPYPANLDLKDVNGFAEQETRDGKLNPPQFHALLPMIYPNGMGCLMGNRVTEGVLWLTNGRGQICRIRASDGACVSWGNGKAPAPPAQGPISWAASPDGRAFYLAGWYDWWKARKRVPDGQIFEVDPATGERTPFAKITVAEESFWLREPNGWYHYTNWGRKNGMSAIHGLAVDGEGRVFACDRVNHRIAVYDRNGSLRRSAPLTDADGSVLRWPDHVALSPRGEEIYVTTRKVIDGYKAINEIKILKLSSWADGKVVAQLTLFGHNAPALAVHATEKDVVLWLSNVSEEAPRKGKAPDVAGITRIRDGGDRLVVAGKLGRDPPLMPEAVVKVWADPESDDIVVSDGWSGLTRYCGVTGKRKPFPLTGMDICFGPDGNIYVYGQKGWHELVARFDRNFKPVPFPATGKNTTTLTSTGKDVYGRYGHGWSNKGLCVAPRGRIYVHNMYDWCKYFVNVWDATGKAEKHGRVAHGLVGPTDAQGGGIRVDYSGNIYVGLHGGPRGQHEGGLSAMGAVVKFSPSGGGYVREKGEMPGMAWAGGLTDFVEGAVAAYPTLAPQQSRGCVCKEARFDIDGWGRLYIPNGLEYSVRIVDNAGGEIVKFGHYGNPDSRGPESATAEPEIPFGWPIGVSAGHVEKGRLYVADTLNRRVVRVDLSYALEKTLDVPAR